MSTQHTHGPWHVANGVQIRSERHQVAKVWMMRNGEGTANARLIAAAPDLYAALYALVAAVSPGDVDAVAAALIDAERATNKAEGKS